MGLAILPAQRSHCKTDNILFITTRIVVHARISVEGSLIRDNSAILFAKSVVDTEKILANYRESVICILALTYYSFGRWFFSIKYQRKYCKGEVL